jgi:magnesium chelatase subunit D
VRQAVLSNESSSSQRLSASGTERLSYPFAAIVGHEDAKLALILAAVAPQLGGVLVQGGAGTAKSTLARSVHSIMPGVGGGERHGHRKQVPFVKLPLNVSEDRLLGGLDVESTLTSGRRVFSPGLLAEADGGCLYLDHANLLAPSIINHIAAALDGQQVVVEREGFSRYLSARFTLIAVCDLEEGELPEVLRDRIGLIVQSDSPQTPAERRQIVERAEQFDRNPQHFSREYETQTYHLRYRIVEARTKFDRVMIGRGDIERLSRTALDLGVVGNRPDIFAACAARACAALSGRTELIEDDLVLAIRLVLLPRATKDSSSSSVEGETKASPPCEGNTTPDTGKDAQSKSGSAGSPMPPDGLSSAGPSRVSADEGEHTGPAGQLTGADDDSQVNGAGQPPSPQASGLSVVELIARAISSPIPPALQSILGMDSRVRRQPAAGDPSRSARGAGSSPANSGRYSGASTKDRTQDSKQVAVDATLRAAAPHQRLRRKAAAAKAQQAAPVKSRSAKIERATAASDQNRIILKPSDLRFKRFKKKRGTLFIFAVDASSSMAMGRIGQAKGTVIRLLQQSYLNRDNVAVVAFGGEGANVLLPPTRSVARARSSIESLPAGGATPVAAGVLQALDVARVARRKLASRVILLILTDGRANVSATKRPTAPNSESRERRQAAIAEELRQLGRMLHKQVITTVVMDTGPRFTSRGDAISLSSFLGAKYVHLPRPDSKSIYEALKQISTEDGVAAK